MSTKSRRRILAALLALATTSIVASSPEADSGDAKVAYALSVGSKTRLVGWLESYDVRSGERRALTSKPRVGSRVADRLPIWSPDGASVAFVRRNSRSHATGVYVLGADGTTGHIATVSAKNYQAVWPLRWAPAGDRLVFDRWGNVECRVQKPFNLRFMVSGASRGGSFEIAATPRPRKLVQLGDIRWSPDGTQLLYIVYELDNSGYNPNECRFHRPESLLYSVGAHGTDRRLLAQGEVQSVAWAPDGDRIAYVDCENAVEACDLLVAKSDGTTRRVISSGDVVPAADIAWTPDGQEVLVSDTDGLHAVDTVTKTQRTIASFDVEEFGDWPAEIQRFSSDGDTVALLLGYGLSSGFRQISATTLLVDLRSGRTSRIVVRAPKGASIGDADVYLP